MKDEYRLVNKVEFTLREIEVVAPLGLLYIDSKVCLLSKRVTDNLSISADFE
jgi:hypothetical protein